MKIRPLSRDEVRQVDRIAIEEYRISGLVLMENAGSGAARIIHEVAATGTVVILCGKGNNAGDGYVIARHLELLGRDVQLVSIVDTDLLTDDAKANFDIAVQSDLSLVTVDDSDSLRRALSTVGVIIDCLLGTGTSGPLRGLFAEAVRIANQASAVRIAIDIPTGIDCDSGEVLGEAFDAAETITFVAPKLAMENPTSQKFFGRIHVVGIGAPKKLLQRFAS